MHLMLSGLLLFMSRDWLSDACCVKIRICDAFQMLREAYSKSCALGLRYILPLMRTHRLSDTRRVQIRIRDAFLAFEAHKRHEQIRFLLHSLAVVFLALPGTLTDLRILIALFVNRLPAYYGGR